MSLGNIFDITGSALTAQSARLNTTASNLANVDSISSSYGETYRSRQVVLQSANLSNQTIGVDAEDKIGVRVAGVVEAGAEPQKVHRPDHPMADAEGNVFMANINMVEEMTNMIEASRSYQTNVQVATTAKQLIQQTLRLGQ